MLGALESQRECQSPPELELQTIVNPHVGAGKIEPQSSSRAASALTTEPSPSPSSSTSVALVVAVFQDRLLFKWLLFAFVSIGLVTYDLNPVWKWLNTPSFGVWCYL